MSLLGHGLKIPSPCDGAASPRTSEGPAQCRLCRQVPSSRSRRRLHSRCARPSSLRSPLAEVRRSRQRCFGLGNKSAHYLAHRQNLIDASSGLARPEHTLVLTARLGRRDDLTPQAIAIATRLLALAAPLIQKSRRKRAPDRVETDCARERADVVENIDLYRILRTWLRLSPASTPSGRELPWRQ